MKFHESVFPFKLTECSVSDCDNSFRNAFPFNDSNLCFAYDDTVSDKMDDFSISIEERLIKNQGGWNSEASEVSNYDLDESITHDFFALSCCS